MMKQKHYFRHCTPNLLRQQKIFSLTILYKKCRTIFSPCQADVPDSIELVSILDFLSQKGIFLFIAFLIILYYLFPFLYLAINCDAKRTSSETRLTSFCITKRNERNEMNCPTYLLQKRLAQYANMHEHQSKVRIIKCVTVQLLQICHIK